MTTNAPLSYTALLDDAEERFAGLVGLDHAQRVELGIRDLIRTTYCAASNANAICESEGFARDLFIACCNAAQVELVKRLARADLLKIALRLHIDDYNPFLDIIGDLFND